jgi:hypothetical protein
MSDSLAPARLRRSCAYQASRQMNLLHMAAQRDGMQLGFLGTGTGKHLTGLTHYEMQCKEDRRSVPSSSLDFIYRTVTTAAAAAVQGAG